MTRPAITYNPNGFFSNKYRVVHHILFWVVYVVYSVFLNFFSFGFGGIELFFFIMLFDVTTIYFNIAFLIPKYLVRNKLLPYILLTFTSVFLNVMLNFLLQKSFYGLGFCNDIYSCACKLSYIVVLSEMFLVIAIGLKLLKEYLYALEKINQLKEINFRTELDFLKTQVNPHFLFNTLNNIKVLIDLDKEKAVNTLFKLSGLLRYQLYDCSEEKVLLSSEVKYLQNYLDLQRIRVNKADIDFRIEGKLDGILVYPFMFIPFLENAVKHGLEGGGDKAKLEINIKILNKSISFIVKNTKNNIKSDKGGIGIVNVKRRLEMLYPDRYNLLMDDAKDIFTVKLTINIE